jgi:hypothetical protein
MKCNSQSHPVNGQNRFEVLVGESLCWFKSSLPQNDKPFLYNNIRTGRAFFIAKKFLIDSIKLILASTLASIFGGEYAL